MEWRVIGFFNFKFNLVINRQRYEYKSIYKKREISHVGARSS
ncbi:MAG: hypothetical protein UR53_C0002G0006 [Candidatus Magasanikbacteria bacterium GW2011_GWC2_34_16]|uniref:Uncharacterized protein n=2 Tax=Candidatus Magasanikiibacteriota TaxID=1752731 RepID=A0A0G0HB49_9BACT|nr:MAG: hypothetical protein UR53_C0002G0006 [Candidatus Magasanikbacteria bacterium GW2011_GWC2_34_16]KKQ40503.1 MAG: hypothetical protein US58_C0019G0016 [Candidatus Magasanikbacteria bacterium GW2011_GWA2_37_8]